MAKDAQHPYREGKNGSGNIFDENFVLDAREDAQSPYREMPPASGGDRQNKKRFATPKPAAARREPPREKPPKRRRSWKVRAPLALLLLFVLGVGSLGIYLGVSTRNDDLWLDLDQIPYKTETVIYAREEGGEWEEYATLPCTQNKQYVDGSLMPRYLKDAFVAVEDKDFYDHHGVNFVRTVYAALNEIKYALTGSYFGGEDGIKIGASTITQQLVKNLTRDDDASGLEGYLRKVREIWRALRMDAAYDKETILEAYLNTISFTDNTAGVAAAAEKLFGTTVDKLTLAQCASLAAITRSPARYNPVTRPQEHLERRNYVLDEMLEEGFITQQEHDAAVAEPLVITGTGKDPERDNTPTDYFTDALIEDLIADLSDQRGLSRAEATRLLYDGGLRIYATVVPSLQQAMEQTLESAYLYPRPGVTVTAQLEDEDGNPLLDEDGNPQTGPVTVYPQAAMVSLNYEGELCAVVGGLGEKEISRGFNRGTQALRQVGSTMKPIGAYVLGIEEDKINWSSAFEDSAVRQIEDEKTGELKDWPRNFSGSYSGKNLLVADALARSINTIAVRVGERVGVGRIYRFTTKELGITSFVPADKDSGPMILGSSTTGVTLEEMAGAYSIFGSGGSFTTIHSYTSVARGTGETLLEPEIETKQVISSDTAYIMNRLLAGVMQGAGTGAGYAVNDGMDSVGKTGTTSDNRDHWFIGLTPYYVTASWYGYDENLPLEVNYSAHPPTLAWRNVMRAAQRGLAVKEFPIDETVEQVEYCTVTGLLPGAGCPTATGYYKPENRPVAVCPGHG